VRVFRDPDGNILEIYAEIAPLAQRGITKRRQEAHCPPSPYGAMGSRPAGSANHLCTVKVTPFSDESSP